MSTIDFLGERGKGGTLASKQRRSETGYIDRYTDLCCDVSVIYLSVLGKPISLVSSICLASVTPVLAWTRRGGGIALRSLQVGLCRRGSMGSGRGGLLLMGREILWDGDGDGMSRGAYVHIRESEMESGMQASVNKALLVDM